MRVRICISFLISILLIITMVPTTSFASKTVALDNTEEGTASNYKSLNDRIGLMVPEDDKGSSLKNGTYIDSGKCNLYGMYYTEDDDEGYDGFYERKARRYDFTLDHSCRLRIMGTIVPKELWYDVDDWDSGECIDKKFNYIKKGRVVFSVINENGKVVDKCSFSMKDYEGGETNDCWFYTKKMRAGDYTLKIASSGKTDENYDALYTVSYTIKGYKSFAKKASIKRSVSKAGGSWVRIGKFVGKGIPHFKKIVSSNKSAVNGWWITKGGTIYVWARAKGNSKVTLILKNGKKYKTTVSVKSGYPDFFAYLSEYNTRGNYFVVRVKNCGVRNITIIRQGAKVTDKDYKSYDRRIRGSSNVVIKPGKTKSVRFYVNGGTTWPDVYSFTMHANFKYEGRKYTWKTASDYSWYKRGKYWYDTFWGFGHYCSWQDNDLS